MDIHVAPYTSKLNHGNAYWMARLAHEVYRCRSEDDKCPDEDGILNQLQADDPKFISVLGVDINSAQAALIEHKNYLCMSFRGSDELIDWIDSINAFSCAELFGEFHRGFFKSLEDVWPALHKRYKKLCQHKTRPLFLTGHSLGGAMVSIAAAKLIQADQPFVSAYTFGQPRAMNPATARIFNNECDGRYFRFHNNNDIVTRVPARVMGYSHVGSYLYIDTDKSIYTEPGFWFRFIDLIDGAVSRFKDESELGFDSIKDHAMGDYLQAIKNWKFEG